LGVRHIHSFTNLAIKNRNLIVI